MPQVTLQRPGRQWLIPDQSHHWRSPVRFGNICSVTNKDQPTVIYIGLSSLQNWSLIHFAMFSQQDNMSFSVWKWIKCTVSKYRIWHCSCYRKQFIPQRLTLQRLYKKVQISMLSIFQLLGFLTPLAFGQISSGISFLIQHLIGFQFLAPEKANLL